MLARSRARGRDRRKVSSLFKYVANLGRPCLHTQLIVGSRIADADNQSPICSYGLLDADFVQLGTLGFRLA